MAPRIFLLYIGLFCCIYHVQAQQITDTTRQTTTVKQTLRNIYIEGNKRTRRSIILREMSVTEGDKLPAAKMDELAELNSKRIFNLPLFTEVVVNVQPVDDTTVDWLVKVREQWYIIPELTLKLADRNINTWVKEQNADIRRANLGVAFKHRNFRGNLEELSATVQIGYTQKFGLEYFRPYVDKKQHHGIGVSFFFSQNEETFYNTNANKWQFVKKPGLYIIRHFEAATQYVHRPGYANKHAIEVRFRSFQADDTILKLNNDYYKDRSNRLQLMEFTYRYDLNKVDNWNYPTTGLKVVGTAGIRVGIQGFGFQSYVNAEVGYFKRFGRKWLWSEILRGRITAPDDMPYTFRYAMGNASEYVRGYEYYVIDGTQYGLLRTNLKYELLNTAIRNFPIRYLAVIPIRIYPKIFADIGYTVNPVPGTSFLNNRGLAGYGFGVDIVSAYDFKLRLEYTWNHLGQKGLFLHTNSE